MIYVHFVIRLFIFYKRETTKNAVLTRVKTTEIVRRCKGNLYQSCTSGIVQASVKH